MRPFLLLAIWLMCSALFGADYDRWQNTLRDQAAKRLPEGARLEVRLNRMTGVRAGDLRVVGFSPEQPLGVVSFEAEIVDKKGRTLSTVHGTATIRAYLHVAVATRSLSHGESLDAGNTRFEEREIGRLVQFGYFNDKASLEGRRVKGYVLAGAVIGRSNSQPAFLVQPGESVDLVRRRGALFLSAKVRALQGGLKDQWVQVQNPSSGKLFLARVSGPGEVEVR